MVPIAAARHLFLFPDKDVRQRKVKPDLAKSDLSFSFCQRRQICLTRTYSPAPGASRSSGIEVYRPSRLGAASSSYVRPIWIGSARGRGGNFPSRHSPSTLRAEGRGRSMAAAGGPNLAGVTPAKRRGGRAWRRLSPQTEGDEDRVRDCGV